MNNKKIIKIFILIIINIFSFTTCSIKTFNNTTNIMKIHYINVGQGDSILVQINNKNLLIDAGPEKNCYKLLSYLKKQNIKTFDYIIATHPHEDHIGGMPLIIENFNINKFYAPKKIAKTNDFKNMIKALKNKKLKINIAKAKTYLNLGKNTTCKLLGPNNSFYENTNNYSVVVKITYGKNKFLFMGDAENLSEEEILNNKFNIRSDVIKIGHHGSSSSTSKNFLDKVNPKLAIISCGYKNKFNHPHKKTLNKLKKQNIEIYRTDIDGTILILSNGKKIIKK